MAGIPLHKSYNLAVVETGGYENLTCIERDCRNYVEKLRRLRLGEGDAAAIQSYFSKMQANCPGFFFSINLDEESRLRNVFWADNRCREAYKEFGDIVTFDTTYLTNKYDMPFVPFVGVNHHGQSTLLGCGLVSSEDTETFVWLFRTWFQCMQGQVPNGIITDQHRAMQNAIQIVLPNTKHRWCLWHILKKLPEKFGNHVQKGIIFSTIHELVYDSQTPEEFEQGWIKMVEEHELLDNDWLVRLYIDRSRWVPCFLKTSFWAGMSTTQRSESINAFFDGFVHSKTSLKQFVEQYERALKNKVEKEFQTDFRSFSQMVPCITPYQFEKQFQLVYTISKFREFQEEINKKMYCDIIAVDDECSGTTYKVQEDVVVGGGVKRKKFTILFQRDSCEFICSCHLFEFVGIICRHAITVLICNNVKSLPEKYILRRWKRDVTRCHTRVAINYDGWINSPGQLRYDQLCKAFTDVADLAAYDEGRTEKLMEWIQFKKNELSTSKSISGRNHLFQAIVHASSDERMMENALSENILDPNCSRSKGRPKKLRKKGPLESKSKRDKAIRGGADVVIAVGGDELFMRTPICPPLMTRGGGNGPITKGRHRRPALKQGKGEAMTTVWTSGAGATRQSMTRRRWGGGNDDEESKSPEEVNDDKSAVGDDQSMTKRASKVEEAAVQAV
ncbi:protein FAR-RED IMPAIRED RESPONSE 1-like [Diospyros lotus]|uniref:protein FAR-RED IMPAIRED RESPONSE 1-like n=1 Tax=Diospyros lotus TaxID=55363 RepID=UPI00224F239D|nr:protein FAR-RED IMPAIRED RESPONSE 1-like [Diospyros lotus]